MNIFYLDKNPVIAARWLCNKHIIKMSTEAANILLWSIFEQRPDLIKECPLNQSGQTPKLTHRNHPATKWATESFFNYYWLLIHAISICKEYEIRYYREHFSLRYLRFCEKQLGDIKFNQSSETEFKGCFGTFKAQIRAVKVEDAYKEYYILDKTSFARWPSVDSVPDWFTDQKENFIDKSFKNGEYLKR